MAECFIAKWIAAEEARAGLRHAVVYPNVTGMTKDRIAQNKRVRAGSPAIVEPQVARTCFLRGFSLVLRLFCSCFVLAFLLSLKPQPFIQSFFDMQELTDAIRSLANGKAVGPDGVSVGLFNITLSGDPALRRRLPDIVVCIWRRGRCRSSGNMSSSWYSTKRRTGQSKATTGVSRW